MAFKYTPINVAPKQVDKKVDAKSVFQYESTVQPKQATPKINASAVFGGVPYKPIQSSEPKGVLQSAFDSENYVSKFKKGDIRGGVANFLGSAVTGAQSTYLNAINNLASVVQGKGLQPFKYNMSYEDFEKQVAERGGVEPNSEIIKKFSPALSYAYKMAMEIGTDPLELTPAGMLNDIKAAKGVSVPTTNELQKAAQAQKVIPIEGMPEAQIRPTTKDNVVGGMNVPKAEELQKIVSKKTQEPIRTANFTFSDNTSTTNTPRYDVNVFPDLLLEPGQQVRGFSQNIATDKAMEKTVSKSYVDSPDIYNELSNKETLANAQNLFSGGFQTAYDNIISAIASNNVRPEHVPLARMVANQAARNGDVETARKVLSEIGSKLTEAGQLSQAAKILRQSDPMAVVQMIQKYLDKFNAQFGNRKGWQNFKLTDDEIKKLSEIDIGDSDAIEAAIHGIGSRIAGEWKATGFEKFDEFRRIAMLLNPKTQIRNVVGNIPIALERKLANKTSAAIQKMLPADQRTQALFIDENSRSIARQLYDQHKDELFSTNKWDNADLRHIIMEERKVFKSKALEGARLLTYDLLQKGDVPFLKSAFVDRASSYIAAQGYKALDDVPNKVIEEAKREALRATYRDANALSTAINRYKRKGTVGSKFVEATLPFVTTPTNLLLRAVDYSPFGIFNALFTAKDVPTLAKRIDKLSQGLVGSGVLMLGGALAANGITVANAPENKDRAAYMKATGTLPFSIQTPIGSFTYDWAQPVGAQLAMGVEVYKAYKDAIESEDGMTFDKFVNAVANSGYALGDVTLNTSVYRNILELFEGYGSPSERVVQNMTQYPMQAVPTMFGQLTRTIDPNVRSQYDPQSYADTTLMQLKARTPGASFDLPASVDVWGNEIKRTDNPALRAAQEFVNPAQYTPSKRTQKDIVIDKLFEITGDNKVFPSKAPYYFNADKVRYDLKPEEIARFQKTMGKYASEKADNLLKGINPASLTDKQAEQLTAALDKIYKEAREKAKDEYLKSAK